MHTECKYKKKVKFHMYSISYLEVTFQEFEYGSKILYLTMFYSYQWVVALFLAFKESSCLLMYRTLFKKLEIGNILNFEVI